MPRPATDKRERLIAAAIHAFHEHGFVGTSIADVAREAGVAPGNVFYYFRTKDDLAAAVVARWVGLGSGYAAQMSAEPDAWRRIELFIAQASLMSEVYLRCGCPLAGITRDVRRDVPALTEQAGGIYDVQFGWLEDQFTAAGLRSVDARRNARFLMSTYHGAIALAYAQCDATLISDAVAALTLWLAGIRTAMSSAN